MKKNYSNSKQFVKLFIITLLLTGVFSVSSRAHALSLSPVRFEIKGNPGETVTEKIILKNETTSTETYYSSFANFQAEGESGNPTFAEPKDDLGTWMTTQSAVILEPNAVKSVPFSVKIPTNAEPGGHFAVVFWGTSPKGNAGDVSIGANTGVLVLLTVNGEVKQAGGLSQFNLKDNKFWYNTLPVNFEYKFRNDGGDRIKPEGTLKIKDTVFITADKQDGNPIEGNILPNSTRKFDLTWVKHPRAKNYTAPTGMIAKFFGQIGYEWHNFAFGFYTGVLHLSYGTVVGEKSVHFFVFPWQLLLVIILILIIILWGGSKLVESWDKYIIEKAREGNELPPEHSHGHKSN